MFFYFTVTCACSYEFIFRTELEKQGIQTQQTKEPMKTWRNITEHMLTIN